MAFVAETSFLVRKMLLFKTCILCTHILTHYVTVNTEHLKLDH